MHLDSLIESTFRLQALAQVEKLGLREPHPKPNPSPQFTTTGSHLHVQQQPCQDMARLQDVLKKGLEKDPLHRFRANSYAFSFD